MTDTANAAQIDYWNATMGPVWVRLQDQLDGQIAPLGLEAIRALAPQCGEHILDIGCGCGQASLQLAERVGPGGAVTGVDISRPMLGVARQRPVPPTSARPVFREADVQTADLGTAEFDAAFSRFGVMFFADPAVAFANVARALKPGGRLCFVCWAPFADNLWMRVPLEAAAPLLPPITPMDPTAPGPYAFADPDRVRRILTEAGFAAIDIDRFETPIGGADLDQSLALTFQVGPLAKALRENPGHADQVAEAVKSAMMAYVTPAGVLMPSAVWIVRAVLA
jgi:SAM-dependent methyltransferase